MENASINGYVLKYKLGEGGMAEVWYAENSLQKPAAVKILRKKFCDEPELVSRFSNEARLMVQLNHPNIRSIQDYGVIDGLPCMVMEYLEGADLSKRMKNGERFTNEQLTGWWNDMVDALQYTHRKHIIHRDIKPSNLFVTEDGRIMLLDFGVAKIKDNITVTQTGSRMGTLMYMSPEQVYDVKNLTFKTDVYSLAVTFYHLVTGVPPYDSSKISDFEIQESIVRKSIDTSVLPQPWNHLLPGYFNKDAEERRGLHKIDEEPDADVETIWINPVAAQDNKTTLPPPVKPTPLPAQPVHRYPEKQRSPSFFTLLPIAIVLGLIAAVLNKDRIAAFFDSQDSNNKEQVTKVDAKKNKGKKQPPDQPEKNQAAKPDTIKSEEDEGAVDQVIINAGPLQNDAEIKNFVNDYYRGRGNCNSLSKYFNDIVKQYYNKSNVGLGSIQKECETYHGKWRFTEAEIDNNSWVFTHNQNGKVYIDFTMLYKIKQAEADDWIPYSIDVAMVIDEGGKIERIAERRIEKL